MLKNESRLMHTFRIKAISYISQLLKDSKYRAGSQGVTSRSA